MHTWAVRGLEDDLRKGCAVLDLGCGVGHFGAFLWEKFGQRPHGMDVVRHPGFREESYASFDLQNGEALAATGQAFDIIFALGLIEYLPNPRALLASLPPLLAPGGRIMITTPNPASLLSLVSLAVRGEFSAFRQSSNPASITPVLAVDLLRMLDEAGFTDITLDFSMRGRVPFCRAHHYQTLLPFLRGRLWSDDFRCIAQLPMGGSHGFKH